MSADSLGRLVPIDLRQVWDSESGAFTPWLARPENIALLGDTLGLDLDVESTEAGVGPYRADIVCRDTSSGSPDGALRAHREPAGADGPHASRSVADLRGWPGRRLGGLDRRAFTDEHRAALDWLNQRTERGLNFFGLEIELWQIAESPVAPKFNVVAKPNDWNSTVREAANQGTGVSETKQQQLEFWLEFAEFVRARSDTIHCQEPRPQHWMDHRIGKSWRKIESVISTRNPPSVRVGLHLSGDGAKAMMASLEEERESITEEFGEGLTWYDPPDAKTAIVWMEQGLDFREPPQREAAKEWLYQQLIKFHKVLVPRALALDAAPDIPETTNDRAVTDAI